MIKVVKRIKQGGKRFAFNAQKKQLGMLLEKDLKQREAFSQLMPKLLTLRNSGLSFRQIAALLDKAGLKLKLSAVRMYYNDMLLERAAGMKQLIVEETSFMSKLDFQLQVQKEAAQFLKSFH